MTGSPETLDRRNKCWAELLRAETWTGISRVEILRSNVFAPQVVDLTQAMVLLGSHGGGKTTFLRMLEMAFGVDGGGNLFAEIWRTVGQDSSPQIEAEVRVTVRDRCGTYATQLIDVSSPQEEIREMWKDVYPCAIEPLHVSSLHAFRELTLLHQEYPIEASQVFEVYFEYSPAEIRTLKNILGREYDVIRTHIWQGAEGDSWWVPLMKGTTDGRPIETATMSRGEIWVHYLLGYVLRQGSPGPLLLDEPESLLASRGHRALIDEVARLCLAGRSQVIVATHSSNIVSRFPMVNAKLCIQTPQGIRLISPGSMSEIRDVVGLQFHVQLIVLVEDRLAGDILRALLRELAPGVERNVEILAVGGEANVRKGAEILNGLKRIRCIGVLDGDQREVVKGYPTVAFIPGVASPERELILAAQTSPADLASILGRNEMNVLLALDQCKNLDHQYLVENLSRSLEVPRDVILNGLVRVWIAGGEIVEQAKCLVRTISNHAGEIW